MIFYELDLYPATDPKDGARIRRMGDLQREEIRASANGTGSAVIALRGTSDDAEALSPDGLEYLRVVRVNTDEADGATLSGFDERCVHGLFLDSPGDYLALSRERKQLLTLNATGALAYFEREVMWSHTYLDSAIGTDPFDRVWRLYAMGPASGGDKLGAVLWRVVTEGLSFHVPGTEHRHADGVIYTDSHDDDKVESAIPAITMTFDQFEDSSGNAWTKASGQFTAQVGETLLSVIQRLVRLGLYVYLDPDTFELSAWEVANHGRTRTGGAWATDVVRFQAPTGQAIETGNIKSDAVRGTIPRIRRTQVLAGGVEDVYGTETQVGAVPWHGFTPADSADQTALEELAGRELAARNDASDTARIRIRLGDDPANGAYLPLEESGVMLDDRVTVDSGELSWDWQEQTLPVAAVVLRHRRGGDWEAYVDLGSSYSSAGSRSFQGSQTPGHTHAPNPRLCDIHHSLSLSLTYASQQDNDLSFGYLDPDDGTTEIELWRESTDGGPYPVSLSTPVMEQEPVWYLKDHSVVTGTHRWTSLDYAPDASVEPAAYTNHFRRVGSELQWNDSGHPDIPVDAPQNTTDSAFTDLLVDVVTIPSALTGTSPFAARCDHLHNLETLRTTETDTSKTIRPDGAGGLEWGDSAEAHDHPYLTTTDGTDDVRVVAATGASHTIENPTRNVQDLTLTADAVTITMPPAADGKSFRARLREDGSGGRVPTLIDVLWPGGVEPEWDLAPNAVNIVTFDSDASSWHGLLIGAAPETEHDHDVDYASTEHEHAVALPLSAVVDGEPVLVWDDETLSLIAS